MNSFKRTSKKVLAVVLSVLVAFSCGSLIASAVNPQRPGTSSDVARTLSDNYTVTDAALNNVIRAVDGVLNGDDFKNLTGSTQTIGEMLVEMVGTNIYNDELITMLLEMSYPMMCDAIEDALSNTSVLEDYLTGVAEDMIDDYDLYIYPRTLAKYTGMQTYYPEVYTILYNAGYNWGNVNFDSIVWGIEDMNDFIRAMSIVIGGLLPAFRSLLTTYNYSESNNLVANVGLELKTDNRQGYGNAIYPLLNALMGEKASTLSYGSYTGIRTPAQYNTLSSSYDLTYHLLAPIFTWLEDVVFESPVDTVTGLLARLAYNMKAGNLISWLNAITLKIKFDVYIDWGFIGETSVYDDSFTFNVHDLIIDNDIITDAQLTDMDALMRFMLEKAEMVLDLPTIETATLASYYNGSSSNKAQVLLYLLRYVLDGLRASIAYGQATGRDDLLDQIFALMDYDDGSGTISIEIVKEDGTIETVEVEVMGDLKQFVYDLCAPENSDKVIAALVELLNPVEYAMEPIGWLYTSAQAPSTIIESILQYDNNWTQQLAQYFTDELDTILNNLAFKNGVEIAGGTYSDVNTLCRELITNTLFTRTTLVSVLESIQGLTGRIGAVDDEGNPLPDAQADENFEQIADIVNQLLDIDLTAWSSMSVPEFEDGDVDAFVSAFSDMLEPVYPLIEWLFTGKDIKFFKDKSSQDIITLLGADGYAYGIVPLLEALGCDEDDILTDAQYKAAAESDKSELFSNIISPIAKLIDRLGDDPINTVLDMLPNLLYFVQSGGLSDCVENLIHPVFVLIDTARPIYDVDIDELIGETIAEYVPEGFSVLDIDDEILYFLAEKYTGLDFDTYLRTVLDELPKGRTIAKPSANGITTKYEIDISHKDFLTLLLTAADLVLTQPENYVAACELVNQDFIDTLRNLSYPELYAIKEINWRGKDFADLPSVETKTYVDEITGETTTATVYNSITHVEYSQYWSREDAKAVIDDLPTVADAWIEFLGIGIDGENYTDLKSVVNKYLNIYTNENISAIVAFINKYAASLDDTLKDIIRETFEIDINYWSQFPDYYQWGFEDGDRAGFTEALCRVIMPAAPLLKLVLLGEDMEYLNNFDGEALIKIGGNDGYNYGIIPLLEAFDCDNIRTQAQYEADMLYDERALVYDVVDPLFNVLDKILENPAPEIMQRLTNIIYFINSDGATVCAQNVLGAVYSVLNAIYPLTGFDLSETINLEEITLEGLFRDELTKLEADTGFSFTPMLGNAFDELSVGRIVSFTSLNGLKAYRMEYTPVDDQADLLTAVLRLAVKFITFDDNIEVLFGLLEKYSKLSQDEFDLFYALIESCLNYLHTDNGCDVMLKVFKFIYDQSFTVTSSINDFIGEANDNTKFLFTLFEGAEADILRSFGKTLSDFLNDTTKDVFDDGGVASSGAISFFEKIIEWFKKLIAVFKNLFGAAA